MAQYSLTLLLQPVNTEFETFPNTGQILLRPLGNGGRRILFLPWSRKPMHSSSRSRLEAKHGSRTMRMHSQHNWTELREMRRSVLGFRLASSGWQTN